MAESKKKIKIILSALLCLLFLIYIIYHIACSFREKTELFLVTRVTEEHTLDVSGYIFRDETVIYSGTGGICTDTRENGEKVAKDSVLAKTYFTDSDELKKKIDELNYKIHILEESCVSETDNLESIDSQITLLRAEIAKKSADGNVSFTEKAEKELLILLHKRELIENNDKNHGDILNNLREERTLLLSSISSYGRDITADVSGYYYSYTDGYENVFTAQAAENITPESFDSLMKTSAEPVSGAVGKIASDIKWYFVFKTSTEQAVEITEDKYYEFTFTDNAHDEKMSLFAENKIIDHASGEALLVFSCTSVPNDFDFSRNQRAQITISETSGLRVPSSSVRVIDGQTSVYIMKKGVCRIRHVDIIFEKDGYCIVSEPQNADDISVYDRIVIGEKELYDGKVIGY